MAVPHNHQTCHLYPSDLKMQESASSLGIGTR